jgi:AcrR family transcriptional regulator
LRRLLDTTATMLEEEGYADFTLQEVSKRSKVSIGSIYHLFANKQELVREVQIRFLDRINQEHALMVNALRRKGLTLRELIPQSVHEYGEFLRRNAGLLRVFMQIAPMDELVAAAGKESFAQSVRDFELLILDRRDEIRHPDPEHAVNSAFRIMYAAVGRYLGLGTTPDVMAEGDWNALVDDVSLMVLYFLLGDPAELQNGK